MALANFFGKTALAASQVLRDFDLVEFRQRLESAPVLLAFDAAAVASPQGRATIDLSARLLGRLYPYVVVEALDEGAAGYVQSTQLLLQRINPNIDLNAERLSQALVVGSTRLASGRVEENVFYVGSLDWIALFSPNGPVGSGESANPFGAGAAACLGAANVFRAVFKQALPDARPDGDVSLSLLSYAQGNGLPKGASEWPSAIPFADTILVGAGAIGHGTLWALSQLRGVSGTLQVVDDEPIDLSNLQRYALASQADVAVAKVTLAVKEITGTGMIPLPFKGTWAEYLAQRPDWQLPRVAVAVDTAAARISIQSSLPRSIVNAWTQSADLGVSRHPDFLQGACLACLYMPKGTRKSESEMVAEALSLPELEVRELLYRNSIVNVALAERTAAVNQQPLSLLLPFVGQPLRTFYQETVCGGVLLTSSSGNTNETPMAFQSALAGIMLAAELIAEDLDLRPSSLPATTRIDLLRPLGGHLNIPVQKRSDGRCLCHDKHYQQVYQEKYAAPSGHAEPTLCSYTAAHHR
jgi:hypothetical protein